MARRIGISINGIVVSPVVVSTICGHWGTGLMPLALRPDYISFLMLIRETGTTELVKSSTFQPRRGNFIWWKPHTWKYVQRIGNESVLNSYAHTNLGISFNAKMMALAREIGFHVIPNFAPDFSKPTEEVILEVMYAVGTIIAYGFDAIEIVPSCPNREHCVADNISVTADCIRAVKKKYPQITMIIKKGIQHPNEAVKEWALAGMDILHGINAVPYETVFPGKISPLAHVGGGGVSGRDITEIAFRDNCQSRRVFSGPMIFGGGIDSLRRAEKCFDAGANCVSLCTVVRCNPKEAIKIIKYFNG